MMAEEKTNDSRSWSKMELHFPKYMRFAIFVAFVFFIFHSIQKISEFFNINSEASYTYFIWFSLLMFLFVLLPIRRSAFS